jgi:hypothetical protein
MKIEVELDVFSGRPNPRWTLDTELAQRVADLLQKQGHPKVASLPSAILGYRGFVLQIDDERPLTASVIRVCGGIVSTGSGQGATHFAIPALESMLLEDAERHGHGKLLAGRDSSGQR